MNSESKLRKLGADAQLRTRGSFDRRIWTQAVEDLRDGADALVRALRADLSELPLCVAAYVGDEQDLDFARAMAQNLRPDDTLWLIQADSQIELSSFNYESTFMLDLRNPVHEEASRHIVADALVLSSRGFSEEIVEHWQNRTALAIVDCDLEKDTAKLLDRFRAVSVRLGQGLYRCSARTSPWDSAIARLTEFISALQSDPQRRSVLGASLRSLQHRPAILERLACGLDHYSWPAWAVESLPASYLALDRGGTNRRALAWSYLRDCFDPAQTHVVAEHAGGAIFEVQLSASEDTLGTRLNGYVQPILTDAAMWYTSDAAFHGVLSQMLMSFSMQFDTERVEKASVTHRELAKVA